MKTLNILSGGAAQGLVRSLAPAFEAETGLSIAGDFGAVGAMADKLRTGAATDIVILTAALIAKLADGYERTEGTMKQTRSTPSPDYGVGYGRPPKASRFRKGQSGNPRGQNLPRNTFLRSSSA
ncbi:hypothetical protein ACVIHH_003717 [Bradyrhizobium sp. USDA 4518]|uniref:substrate-binding domain-containing protein n=1 Tax=Bradyrhizobium brasilense TaxID=1419277 RepID=UPI001FCE1428|nr:substrate-binding domain-containing protein [Bradyrhizobium brasilense]